MSIDKAILEKRVDDLMPEMTKFLGEIVAIPSVSSDVNSAAEMQASADLISAKLLNMGFETMVVSANTAVAQGKPAIVASKKIDQDAPTILLYAHHDVQPVGEIDRWNTPPFTLAEEEGRLYGRGAADDGAGIVVHLAALTALGEDLNANVVVFIEGEEEIGSPTFSEFLKKFHSELCADVIIVADSSNWDEATPAITSTLRGVCSCDVKIKVLEHSVHSGMFGGPILDAVTLSSRLISTLHDKNGDVAVAGLGGSDTAQVDWDEKQFRLDASVVDSYKLNGTGDLAARIWTKPAVAVIGMDARPVDESSNTIASECRFRLSLRTVPGADPEDALKALVKHLEENCPFGAKMTITGVECGPGFISDPGSPAMKDFAQCLQMAWGTEPVNIGIGGSIPFVNEFKAAFPNAEILVTGVEDPKSNAHSENESLSKLILRNGIIAEALFLSNMSK